MDVVQFKEYIKNYIPKVVSIKKEHWVKYHKVYCGFDIETTSQNEKSFMYIWQFSFMSDNLDCVVVKGRTWVEFSELLKILRKELKLNYSVRMIIWVANLGYEFQFMNSYLRIDKIFAKTPRNPLVVECTNGVEFREALSISQGSLAYLAKTWTTTQKMLGDLDYNIKRNSLTMLDYKEGKYCDNDVIILAEFSQKIFEDYIVKEKYIPLTSTGILRHDLKKEAKSSVSNPRRLYAHIRRLYPKTKEDYMYIMTWLFRGGYVHSNHRYTNVVCENMDSFDFKSSYPAVAFQEYYPTTPFVRIEKNVSRETLDKLCNEYCVIFQATFKNVKATTTHSIESKSKCIDVKNALYDNGRIFEAESMTVFLTELDYQSYKEFYTWDDIIIHTVDIANRGLLPKYLLDRFYYWFEKKESIADKDSQDYAITKTRINGHFGLCVTKLCFQDVAFENGEWKIVESEKSYRQLIDKEVLSPYYGIYITAHARRRELMLLYKMSDYVVYSDTDSHKCFSNEHVYNIINEYNRMIVLKNKEVCKRYDYSFDIIGNIGIFECETKNNPIKRFKTLGAKRYVTEYADGKTSATVSGLPKKSLENYCKENNLDIIEVFKNDLIVPSEYTHKLVSIYNDFPYDEIVEDIQGNIEKMHENSGVYLKPSDYHLTVEKTYLQLLIFWLERIKRYGY